MSSFFLKELILIKKQLLTTQQKNIIVGTLLANATLSPISKGTCNLKFNHNMSNEEYISQRYNFIVWAEETGVVKTALYRDSKGFPTIGAGFKFTSNWEEILKAFGFETDPIKASAEEKAYIQKIRAKFYTDTAMTKEKTFTTAEIETLQTELDAIMAERAGSDTTKHSIFSFTDTDEIKATFKVIADEREKTLTKWLNTKGLTIPDSNERITLLSLVYNNVVGFNADGTLKSTKLLDALAAGNRAEAWFEIRYNSNGDALDGIAKRRYFEADYFDLYEAGTLTDEEKTLQTKTIFRMYTIHKDKIISYDTTYGAQVAKANSDYNVTWVKSLSDDMHPAKDYLTATFAPGAAIDNIIVGAGLQSYAYKQDEKNPNDYYLQGTDKNDLIFGEGGSDLIYGNTGADVIYGGSENDTLYGEGGSDTLLGEGGDDILVGGTENDKLYGGEGFDTYNSGKGNDTITDSDGSGMVFFDTTRIINGFGQSGVWQTPDRTITLTQSGNDLIVTKQGNTQDTITIKDYFTGLSTNPDESYLGIRLTTIPDDPQTTNTIVGDLGPGDTRPDIDGLQMGYDQWGNLITDPNTPVPDTNDILYDTPDSDRIEGKGGNDEIYAIRGQADRLLGGDGNDGIMAGEGNDIVEGGEGSDGIYGGTGNDQLFGKDHGEMSQLIAEGETASGVNARGDLIAGNEGDDLMYGTNANDLLFGGEGHDLLVGGAGDDVLVGDINITPEARPNNWSATVSREADTGYYSVFLGNIHVDPIQSEGSDTLYGGAGDDWVEGGAGDDYLDGGKGNDTIGGGEGNDVIRGGAGNDILVGGAGNDIYVFNPGDGRETIRDSAATGDINTIKFGAGIN